MQASPAPAPGWLVDADGARRWWDGSRFIGAALTPSLGAEELERAVATFVEHGYRLTFRSPRRAVLERRQRVRILLNLALTVATGGFWLLILALRLLNWPVDRVVLTVDDHGVLVPEFS